MAPMNCGRSASCVIFTVAMVYISVVVVSLSKVTSGKGMCKRCECKL